MSDHLFDPAPFTDGRPRTPRTRKQPDEPARVRLGYHDWRLVSVKGQPGAHIVLYGRDAQRVRQEIRQVGGGAVTLCRKLGTPLTFDDGTLAGGCAECIKRGGAQVVA